MKDYQFFGATKYLAVPLSKISFDDYIGLETKNTTFYIFEDPDLFSDYIYSDFVDRLIDECGAEWLSDWEECTLTPDVLPRAIKIMEESIQDSDNARIVDYLIVTKEMMELALSLDTFFVFSF